MSWLRNIFAKKEAPAFVTVVSGLPRSGTSLMMKMLEAGGIPAITDEIRTADNDNPKGYYEFERVKKLPEGDVAWLPDAQGKAVKVISALLKHLPPGYPYRVIFMKRHLPEVLASQRQMLINRGEDTDKISDEEISRLFVKHLADVDALFQGRSDMQHLYLSYNELLASPLDQIDAVNQFLGGALDLEKMADTIDPNLYRQRR